MAYSDILLIIIPILVAVFACFGWLLHLVNDFRRETKQDFKEICAYMKTFEEHCEKIGETQNQIFFRLMDQHLMPISHIIKIEKILEKTENEYGNP